MKRLRKIVHIDMDAFFASIEQRDHPEWRGKPLVVAGNSSRGVVAAASYEAREFGIFSAMPVLLALQKCPNLLIVPHRFELYKKVNKAIRDIFLQYTEKIEFLSLDEAYLDVTDNKLGIPSGSILAKLIREQIKRELDLNASAGISFNKFLAKIASDINKPNGQFTITPEEAPTFIEQLPIKKFFGIGKAMADKMQKIGIKTGADLKKWSQKDLVERFGKSGYHYFNIVHLKDEREVKPHRDRKSWSIETTFHKNLTTEEEVFEKLEELCEQLAIRTKNIRTAKTITLKIKLSDFQSFTKSYSPGGHINQKAQFILLSSGLVRAFFQDYPDFEIRLMGVGLSNFEKGNSGQQLAIE